MFKFILSLKDYKRENPRLNGFVKLQNAGLSIPLGIMVVSHEGFSEYKKNGLTTKLRAEIEKAFKITQKLNPGRSIIIRRAYLVPGLKDPPGPHSPFLINPDVAVIAVKEIFDFALEQHFDKPQAEICAWIQPVVDEWEYKLVGGCATPSINNPDEVVIEAIYGEDEGVQSCPHDIYTVNFKERIIVNKEIQHKIQYIKYSDKKMNIRETPRELQDKQVLDDYSIMQVARAFEKVTSKYGPHRLEFTHPAGEEIYFLECSPFDVQRKTEESIQIEGEITVVEDLGDIETVKKNNHIVFIHPSVIAKRDRNLLTTLAVNTPHQTIILYPGTATTAHAATIFREMGHKLVFVPDKKFINGDRVWIQLEQGELTARKIVAPKILWLNEVKKKHLSLVGGKAGNLAALKNHGFPVPDAFVWTTEAGKADLKKQEKEIWENLKRLKTNKFAVRSSATCEDQENASFAGQFESYLAVPEKKIVSAINNCCDSLKNKSVALYAKHYGINLSNVKMAVILQKMIFAEKGGVIFTKDLTTNSLEFLTIEATKGLGEKIVSGAVNPEKIVIEKKSSQVVKRKSAQNAVLTEKETLDLTKIAGEIEKFFHKPQDIEWAIMKGKIYILQARPLT